MFGTKVGFRVQDYIDIMHIEKRLEFQRCEERPLAFQRAIINATVMRLGEAG